MSTTMAVIPFEGEYWQESLAVAHDGGHMLLIAWLENRPNGVLIRTATLNAGQPAKLLNLDSQGSGLAVTALSTGGFGLVRARRRVVEACTLSVDGSLSPFQPVQHHGGGADFSAVPLKGGAIGLCSARMMIAHLPEQARTYITTVTDDAWQAGAATLANGEIVRVTMGQHEQYLNPPRYRIRVRRFDADLDPLGETSVLLPTRIIGDMYANPQRPVVLPLRNSGFAVFWTLLPHSRGSEVQLQCFNGTGEPQGPIVTLGEADLSAHIATASSAETASGRLVVGWTRTSGEMHRTELVCYAPDLQETTMLHQGNWVPFPLGLALASDGAGRVLKIEANLGGLTISRSD